MGIKENIKNKFGQIKLKNELKSFNRKKVFHNFNSARTIGILFDGTNSTNYESARSFAKFISEYKIKTHGLGFVDSKEVSNFYSYYTGFNFFTIKETNWQGIPTNHNVTDFINEKFSILIDMHIEENFQLDYICAKSFAEFKIGPLINNRNNYDLMIDISSNPVSEFLNEQIKYYLSTINT